MSLPKQSRIGEYGSDRGNFMQLNQHIMRVARRFRPCLAAACCIFTQPAYAQDIQSTGRLLQVEGHEVPSCRRLLLRDDSGPDRWFRIPDTGADNSILAVSLAALGGGKKVRIAWQSTLTSGCGTEPKVLYIAILAD
jgi:hypothetical protein